MIVVDVGCVTHGRMNALDESLRPLIRRFNPSVYFGFDIYPGLLDGETTINETHCIFMRRAAWTHNGMLSIVEQGNCTHVSLEEGVGEHTVPAFDFGAFLTMLPDGPIVKMDIEGAEYPLLWDLHERGIDRRIEHLLVEWHPKATDNGFNTRGQPPLLCSVEDWQ